MSDLDRIDVRLLGALQNDARLSNKELAGIAGLAPSSTLQRVRRLRERGVLRGTHAEVDPAALGIGLQAMVIVRLQQHHRDAVQGFRDHLATLEPVVTITYVGGDDDFLVHVAVRDTAHLQALLMDAFASRPEVGRLRTELIFEQLRRPVLPVYL
jgi:DNA-binding Lrp family transcriptional regulator